MPSRVPGTDNGISTVVRMDDGSTQRIANTPAMMALPMAPEAATPAGSPSKVVPVGPDWRPPGMAPVPSDAEKMFGPDWKQQLKDGPPKIETAPEPETLAPLQPEAVPTPEPGVGGSLKISGVSAPKVSDRKLRAAAGKYSAALETQADVALESAAETSGYLLGQEQAQVEQQERVAQAEEIRQTRLTELEDDFREMSVQARNMRVDPDKYWNDRGTAGKIMAAIAMGFGALAQAYTKGPNAAMQIINKAIDRDIMSQRIGIQQARGALEAQKGLLAMARQRFGDERHAETVARANYRAGINDHLKMLEIKHEGTQAGANIGVLRAANEEELAKDSTAIDQWNAAQAQKAQFAWAKAAGARAKAQADRGADFVPGSDRFPGGMALGKEQAKKAQEAVAYYDPLLDQIAELRKLVGKSSILPADRARIISLGSEIRASIKSEKGINLGAAVTEIEMKEFLNPILSRNLATVTGDWWGVRRAKLDALKKSLERKADVYLRQQGLPGMQSASSVAAQVGGGLQ